MNKSIDSETAVSSPDFKSSNTNPNPSELEARAKANRKTAILMMLVFLAPVLIAYVLLKTGIYQNFGTSNQGTLLNPPVQITDYTGSWEDENQTLISSETFQSNWWLAYEMPSVCEDTCQQRLLQIRQSMQTVGPEQHRVKPLILINKSSDFTAFETWRNQLEELKIESLAIHRTDNPDSANLSLTEFMQTSAKPADSQIQDGGLYIIDPMGYVMLYYAPVSEPKEAISQAKSFIKDLKYLLKVSRIG